MNLGEEALDGYIESVIISQPDYPERRIVLINYTMAVAYILVAITLIYFIASAIFSVSSGSTIIEFCVFNISWLKFLSDEIMGNPHAIASTIALQHPSLKVGRTKVSEAFKYTGI